MLPRPAATILVLCDAVASFKVLMMRRHSKARFMPHAYVFPGGGAEEQDHAMASALPSGLPLKSWRLTALRELAEETGITLDGDLGGSPGKQANPAAASKIVPFAHWITPKQEKYRYDTWFFVAAAQPSTLDVPFAMDPAEVTDLKWVNPQDAIALHLDPDQEFFLPPPTYLIMHGLSRFKTSAEVVRDVVARGYNEANCAEVVPVVEPTLEFREEGPVKMLRAMHLEEGWTHLPKGHYHYPMVTSQGSFMSDVFVGGAIAGLSGPPSRL
jgi:8-oxo-dGTP pyrophosphatase MutT (NUDIX family)